MMYFNNVHILNYVLIAIIGLVIGRFVGWCNIRLPENKKILSKEFFIKTEKSNYIFMIVIAIIYILLLYKFGLKSDDILRNIELIKFLILTPMLILTFSIDLKYRIIPNRLTLTIFEFGIMITFLYGIININMVKDYLLGAVWGIAIFGIITLLGGFLAGKEAMGLGDVKFMGAIGLYFGGNSMIEISLLSFIIAAICSMIVILVRVFILKKKDEYIPFGPFLAISSFVCMFLPSGLVIGTFLTFCKSISDKLF